MKDMKSWRTKAWVVLAAAMVVVGANPAPTAAGDSFGGTIRATGTMRSITEVGGVIVDDVRHEFIAIAVDGPNDTFIDGPTDTFNIHFKTPFWNTDNPLCTTSSVVAGGCRFGGNLALGEVAVGRTQGGIRDSGAGIYTDPSVAQQVSTFTMNRNTVSCGVGTIAASEDFTGPFAMMMYSLEVESFETTPADSPAGF